MRRLFQRVWSEPGASEPMSGGAAGAENGPPRPIRADRRRRRRRAAAKTRAENTHLAQEQLESRIALAVYVAGYEDAFDYFAQANDFQDEFGFRRAPHSPDRNVHGRAVIASDNGDDVFIRQVASVTQDLQVDTSSNFLNYQIIDGIDERYQQIFVTNGTLRNEPGPLLADVLDPEENDGRVTDFQLIDEEIVPGTVVGTIEYTQDDGTLTVWDFTDAAGIGPGPAVLPGYIEPISVELINMDTPNDYGQSVIRVGWSDRINPYNELVLSANYETGDEPPPGADTRPGFSNNVPASVPTVQRTDPSLGVTYQVVRVTMPEALSTLQDGISERQSLGIIPGTFRGEKGAISVTWSDGIEYDLPAFRSDVNGVLRFNQFLAPPTYLQSVYKDSSAYIVPSTRGSGSTLGLVDIRGTILTEGVLELEFRKWRRLNPAAPPGGGYAYQTAADLLAGPGPVVVEDVDYLTYTRDAEPNEATFWAGQTITREVTVDLLTPGSTVNVDSPIILDGTNTSFFQSTVDPDAVQFPGVDFRATNINIRAEVQSPDRFSVGRSQVSRERLSIPDDDVNPYLLSPSMPSLYDREPPLPPILPAGGLPEIRSAAALAKVNASGQVFELELLPGYQGFGYDPDNPPTVTIAPPAGGGVQATARAVVGPDGTIANYVISNPGTGYMGAPGPGTGVRPLVTVTAPVPQSSAAARVAEINAATGQVVRIDVLDQGYRYHAPPRVIVAPPDLTGFGVQATARAILDNEGRLAAIEVVNPGSGYAERPIVSIAAPSPVALAETLTIEAQIRGNIFEWYVGDDFGTDVPRGRAILSANGTLSTTGAPILIDRIVPPPLNTTPTRQTVVLVDPATNSPPEFPAPQFPPGYPVGAFLEGAGVRQGTRVLAYNQATGEAELPLGSVAESLGFPLQAEFPTAADSLYLEATRADVFLEGRVLVANQSYLFNSRPREAYLAPFLFTTRSTVTGTQTGVIEGEVVDITMGNAGGTPLEGETVEHVVDLRTRIDSLRVRAASSNTDPQGPFPYRLTIEEEETISIDALAASSLPISVSAGNQLVMTSGVDTYGDIVLDARSNDGTASLLNVTAPIRTRYGQVSIGADTVEIRNSLEVTSAAVVDGQQDIILDARGGNLVIQGAIYAPNNVVLEQVNRVDEIGEVTVVAFGNPAPTDQTQAVTLARVDGSRLPNSFNPVGVQLVGDPLEIPPGATIQAWDPATSTAQVAILTPGTPPVTGAVPFAAALSRVVGAVVAGEIDGALSRINANQISILAEGTVNVRTDANELTATAGPGFVLSELNDISIPLLSAGGLVSLEALGVDLGPQGQNPIALTANLIDVTNLTVNVPNGSARIDTNTDQLLLVGNAREIFDLGSRATPMLAAGDVTIRSQSGDVVLLDAPIAGGNGRPVRVATSDRLPVTATYLPGVPGIRPSSLSGAGSINSLGAGFWGTDSAGRPITLGVGDLVLVKDQPEVTTPGSPTVNHKRENGVYRVASVGGGAFGSQRWQLVRDAASDTVADMPNGTLVKALEGLYADQSFAVSYDSIIPTLVERVSTNQLQFPEFFPNFDLLEVGGVVNGTGIAPDSFITAIDPVARVVTLGVVDPGQTFGSGLGAVAVASTAADTITLGGFGSWQQLSIGQEVTGAGILPGSVITRIDPATAEIDLAKTLLGPARVQVSGSVLTFDPLPTDPPFTQFTQLEVGQQVQLYDTEANLLGTRTITNIDLLNRQVTLSAGGVANATTARIWTPGALPTVFSSPIVTPRPSSVILAPNSQLAAVRVGQRFQLRDASSSPVGLPREVASVTIRTDATGAVVGDVTIGFTTLLSAADIVNLAGGTIDFLSPSSVEFGVAAPDAVPVTWNLWAASNLTAGTILSSAGPVATMAPSPNLFERTEMGNVVEFLDATGTVVGLPATVAAVSPATSELTFSVPTPATATQVRISSRTIRLPDFAPFDELVVGIEVFGTNVPAGAMVTAIDEVARTITIDLDPVGSVTQVSLGISPNAQYPAVDSLVLSPDFTNYERLFEGQPVYGAGIEAGAKIVAIDRIARTISLTPGSVGAEQGPIRVTQRSSFASPFYSENFDDWVELDFPFNDFSGIKVGQRVELRDAAGAVLRIVTVTGVDPLFRTVGLENGSLNGIASNVADVEFLPVSNVRFGVVEGVGSGMVDLLLEPVGLTPITVESRTLTTNIGSDFAQRTATFVASTDGRSNDVTGSLGKMIDVYQRNDTRTTQIDVAVFGTSRNGNGTWALRLDPLFTAYERLDAVIANRSPVFGTPRMFTENARVVSVDEIMGTVTLTADSLSPLAVEDPTRITSVTLPTETPNPDQVQRFEFWNWMRGNVQLLQELPVIRRPITIDGALRSSAGSTDITVDGGVPNPRLTGQVFIDGQRISRNRSGGLVTSGQEVNGFEIVDPAASGSKIARVAIGGFQQGSGIKIDGASDVVVDSVNVGQKSDQTRVPNARGVTVTGRFLEVESVDLTAPASPQLVIPTADAIILNTVSVDQTVVLQNADGDSIGDFTVTSVDTVSFRVTLAEPLPDQSEPGNVPRFVTLAVPQGNTILNSTVVGGLSAGIAIENGAERTYVVGGTVGTSSIDNQVGVFVAGDGGVPARPAASETYLGVNAILPTRPQITSAAFVAGSNAITLPSTFFNLPLEGLTVFFEDRRVPPPLPEGTVITGVDSAARTVYLSNPALRATSATFKIGHVAERLRDAEGDFNTLQLAESVPLEEIFVGQTIRATGITTSGAGQETQVTILKVDRDNRIITIDQRFSVPGTALLSFDSPGQLQVRGNRTGILLRGENTRVTNAAIYDNTRNGIDLVEAGQLVGSVAGFGDVGTTGNVALASWPVLVSLRRGGANVSLPSRFTGTPADLLGANVYGLHIPEGTIVVAAEASATGAVKTVTLSQLPVLPNDVTSAASTISFSVRGASGQPEFVTLESGDRRQLFVGQDVHAGGIESAQVAALRLNAGGGRRDYISLTSPTATSSYIDFSALAAGTIVFAERTASSNRIYANGEYGIVVRHDDRGDGNGIGPAPTRIFANYFGMTDETNEEAPNRLGAIRYDKLVFPGIPPRHDPLEVSRVDEFGNKYGIAQTVLPPSTPIDPVPPGDPRV